MNTDALHTQLLVADTLAAQARLNERIGDALQAVAGTFATVEESLGEHAEDLARLATEMALTNQRIESLTATVGRLMQRLEPPPGELHSVKVPDA